MFSTHCKLSWLPPVSDGGSDVTAYHIERRLTSGSCWLAAKWKKSADVTEAEVLDLVDGNEYEFRVSAENKVGQGAPSDPTAPVMAKDPWGKSNCTFYLPIHVCDTVILRVYGNFSFFRKTRKTN